MKTAAMCVDVLAPAAGAQLEITTKLKGEANLTLRNLHFHLLR